jgi:hypothetical protein
MLENILQPYFKASVFVPGKPFQHSQMFESKAEADPSEAS